MSSHTLIKTETVPLQLAREYFDRLRQYNDNELAITVDWISEETIRLSLSDCATDLARYAEKHGVKISDPQLALEAFFSLEGLRASLDWSGGVLINYLVADATSNRKVLAEEITPRFRDSVNKFFNNQAKLEMTLKAQRVYDGLIPNFESCASLVEFRPVFDNSRTSILHGIISASLSIQVRSNEPDKEIQRLSFQLDVADIEALLLELSRLKQKFAALQKHTEGVVQLLNPLKSLQP